MPSVDDVRVKEDRTAKNLIDRNGCKRETFTIFGEKKKWTAEGGNKSYAENNNNNNNFTGKVKQCSILETREKKNSPSSTKLFTEKIENNINAIFFFFREMSR